MLFAYWVRNHVLIICNPNRKRFIGKRFHRETCVLATDVRFLRTPNKHILLLRSCVLVKCSLYVLPTNSVDTVFKMNVLR